MPRLIVRARGKWPRCIFRIIVGVRVRHRQVVVEHVHFLARVAGRDQLLQIRQAVQVDRIEGNAGR